MVAAVGLFNKPICWFQFDYSGLNHNLKPYTNLILMYLFLFMGNCRIIEVIIYLFLKMFHNPKPADAALVRPLQCPGNGSSALGSGCPICRHLRMKLHRPEPFPLQPRTGGSSPEPG